MKTKYKDLIKLGFKREEGIDNLFFEEHGFDYFFLTYEKGSISFNWDSTTREISMYINNRYYKDVELEEVKEIIDMLKK